MEEWKEYKLGEVINILDYKRIPLSSAERKTREGGFPYYGAQGIIDYIDDYIFDGTYLLIAEDGENLKSKKQDIAQLAHGKYWVNNHAHIVESNGICDIRYLCYILNNIDLSGYITGSAQPKLNQANLSAISIILPPLNLQEQIADFISMFDNKIELNQRINDNLEQQAQALFKSWFVDFEPFLSKEFSKSDSLFGDIPVGWSIVSIKDLPIYITDYVANGSFASLKENVRLYDKPNYAHFIRNTDLKAESYKIYVDKHSYEFLSKSVLEGGEIIISNVGDVGSVFLCPKLQKPMTLGNNIILLRPKNNYSMFYLYMLFKGNVGQHLIDGITGGSAQRKFNKTDFKSIKIMMPPVDILIKFDRIIKPIFSKIEKNREEISRLELVRDTLLPKLMSGEVEINKINN